MAEDIKLVYTGSTVEAMFIEELLKENGIGCIRRDNLQSSVDAGWANGWPETSVQIFVESGLYLKAKEFLEDYFSSRDNE